jgi:hypothetical protein
MTTLSRKQIVVLNVVLLIFGLCIVAYGLALVPNPVVSGLLNAFGTTLAATGSITLLDHVLREKPTLLGPELIRMRRKDVPKTIHNLKETASKVDMLGISLTDFLAEVVKDRTHDLLHNVLNNTESRVRIMFMHPNAPFLRQRSFEDDDHTLATLLDRQTESLKYCIQLYALLENKLKEEKKRSPQFEPRGSLIIKLIEACPYISYERYDKEIYWGLYSSDSPGNACPIFLTTSKDEDMYEKLKAHFLTLLQKGYEDVTKPKKNPSDDHNTLLTVNHQGIWLNEHLMSTLFGAEVFTGLKKTYLKKVP